MVPGEQSSTGMHQDFSIRSISSAASSGSGCASLDGEQKARDMARLGRMVRDFAVEFLQGVFLDAVLEDGSLIPCRCTMDSKLSVLMLQVHSTTRTIDLTTIQEIYSGQELRDI